MKHLNKFLPTLLLFLLPFLNLQAQSYVLLGWNDLGMHCANKTFANLCILPPYNNVHAQAIKKGDANNLPQVVTANLSVTYEIPGNTYSVGKTDFWTYANQLFGVTLAQNVGLKGNGLSGTMGPQTDNFFVEGIPITPYPDNDLVNEHPYQLDLLKLYDANHNLLTTTQNVVPVSNEIHCVQSGCHSSEQDILNRHENEGGFNANNKPVFCAGCHQDNALGTTGRSGLPSLSEAVHRTHGSRTNDCYNCHPGQNTKCLRDTMYSRGFTCQTCHGSVSNVGQTISQGRRPWLDEPRCGDPQCHGTNFAEEPGKLFRMSKGHGGLYCSACHGSPHAIQPTIQANDNLQNLTLQGHTGTLRDCRVCHTVYPTGAGPHGIKAPGGGPGPSTKDTIPPQVTFSALKNGWVVNGLVTDLPNDTTRTNLGQIQMVLTESFNYTFNYNPFTPGVSQTTNWNLRVNDQARDAKAVVTFSDVAGNTTTITVLYLGEDITFSTNPVDFGTQRINKQTTNTYYIIHNPSVFSHLVKQTGLIHGNTGFTFHLTGAAVPFHLSPNSSTPFTLSFEASKTGTFRDTLVVTDTLDRNYYLPIVGKTGSSRFHSDSDKVDFGEIVFPGNTVTKAVTITNTGDLELTITGYIPPFDGVFSTDLPPVGTNHLFQTPIVIQPGGQIIFHLTFVPVAEKTYMDSLTFITDTDFGIPTIQLQGIGKAGPVGVQEMPGLAPVIDIVPEPVKDMAKIVIKNAPGGSYQLSISNLSGECLEELSDYIISGIAEIPLNTTNMPEGVYFIQFRSKDALITRKFTILR